MSTLPPDEPRGPTPIDRVISGLVALTVLALFVLGLLIFYRQATELASRPARKPRTKPSSVTSAPPRERPRTGGAHRAGMLPPKAPSRPAVQKEASAGGVPGTVTPVYQLSSAALIDRYRQEFRNRGVTDEEYITLVALNQADQTWTAALSSAQDALQKGNIETARQTVQEALNALDKRNLFAKAQLLEALSDVEFQGADPEAGQKAMQACDDVRIEIAEIVSKGMLEDRESGVTEEQATIVKENLRESKAHRTNVAGFAELFSGKGQDPKKAPVRVMEFLTKVSQAKDREGGRGPGPVMEK